MGCPKLPETPNTKSAESTATNCNADKVRIAYLKEALTKLLRDPKMAKKAAQIIEDYIHHPSNKTSNK